VTNAKRRQQGRDRWRPRNRRSAATWSPSRPLAACSGHDYVSFTRHSAMLSAYAGTGCDLCRICGAEKRATSQFLGFTVRED
jgi:hypothetical protein